MSSNSQAWPLSHPVAQPENNEAIAPQRITKQHGEESQLSIALAGKRTLDARNRKDKQLIKLLWGAVFVLGGALVFSTATNFRYSGQSQYIPYVLQTDRTGRILNAEIMKPSAVRETTAFRSLIDRELCSWIQDWRAVTTDPYAQKTLADHVYAQLDEHGEAVNTVTEWYRAHDPIERAKQVHVEANVQSLVPQSANVYEVYWKETETNLSDRSMKVSHWRSVLTISFSFPKSDPSGTANADGLYIETLTTPQKDSSNE